MLSHSLKTFFHLMSKNVSKLKHDKKYFVQNILCFSKTYFGSKGNYSEQRRLYRITYQVWVSGNDRTDGWSFYATDQDESKLKSKITKPCTSGSFTLGYNSRIIPSSYLERKKCFFQDLMKQLENSPYYHDTDKCVKKVTLQTSLWLSQASKLIQWRMWRITMPILSGKI